MCSSLSAVPANHASFVTLTSRFGSIAVASRPAAGRVSSKQLRTAARISSRARCGRCRSPGDEPRAARERVADPRDLVGERHGLAEPQEVALVVRARSCAPLRERRARGVERSSPRAARMNRPVSTGPCTPGGRIARSPIGESARSRGRSGRDTRPRATSSDRRRATPRASCSVVRFAQDPRRALGLPALGRRVAGCTSATFAVGASRARAEDARHAERAVRGRTRTGGARRRAPALSHASRGLRSSAPFAAHATSPAASPISPLTPRSPTKSASWTVEGHGRTRRPRGSRGKCCGTNVARTRRSRTRATRGTPRATRRSRRSRTPPQPTPARARRSTSARTAAGQGSDR